MAQFLNQKTMKKQFTGYSILVFVASALLSDILIGNKITETFMTMAGVLYFCTHVVVVPCLLVIILYFLIFNNVSIDELKISYKKDGGLAKKTKNICELSGSMEKRHIIFKFISFSIIFGMFYLGRNVLGALGSVTFVLSLIVKGMASDFKNKIEELKSNNAIDI